LSLARHLGNKKRRLCPARHTDSTLEPSTEQAEVATLGVWWLPESGITIALSLNQADLDPNILARDTLETILTWQGR
jgi:hypothetical protein